MERAIEFFIDRLSDMGNQYLFKTGLEIDHKGRIRERYLAAENLQQGSEYVTLDSLDSRQVVRMMIKGEAVIEFYVFNQFGKHEKQTFSDYIDYIVDEYGNEKFSLIDRFRNWLIKVIR